MIEPSDNSVALTIIGRVHTPFKDPEALPIQGTANTARGAVALLGPHGGGLKDLEGFDRIWLIYVARVDEPVSPVIIPRLGEKPRGVFASRSLLRPNPIGMTCVKLIDIQGATVHVEGVDMLDGSAVIDIKPYVPRYDAYPDAWAGWLENVIPHEEAWRRDKTDD